MSLSEKLELLINADPSQGISAFRQFATETDKSLRTAESSLQRFSSAAMKIGGAGLGVGAVLTQLGSTEQAATQQLEAAVSSAGQSIDEYKSRIDQAVSSEEQFGHSAAETKNALTTLVGSYGDTGKALDEMQLVADLAARKHIALGEAATMVAKAHGGAARLFKEFNIQVGTNAQGTKDYDAALTKLSEKLSGQASAAIDTPIGHLKVLGTQIEDMAAKFGERWGPTVLGVSAGLTALGPIVSGVAGLQAKLAASHLATATAAQAQTVAEGEAAAAEALVTTNSSAAVASLYAQDAALAGSSAAFGVWGLAVAGAVVTAVTAYETFAGSTDDTKLKLAELTKYAQSSALDLYNSYTNIKWEGDPGQIQKWFDMLEHGGTEGIGILSKLREELVRQGMATDDVDAAIKIANEDQQNYNETTALGGKAMSEAAKAADGYSSFLASLGSAMDKTYQSSLAQQKGNDTVAGSINNLIDTVAKEGFTLDTTTTSKGRYNDHALKNIAAVEQTGSAISKMIEQRFEETHSVAAAVQAGNDYVTNLGEQLKAAGFNTTQILQMIAAMHLTPTDIATSFSTNALEQQIVVGKYTAQLKDITLTPVRTYIETLINQGKLDEANRALNDLAAGRTVDIHLNVANPHVDIYDAAGVKTAGGMHAVAWATGGRVDAPRGTAVPGILHGGEYVMTADMVDAVKRGAGWSGMSATQSSGMGAGSSPTVVQHIYGANAEEQQAEAARRLRIEAMLSAA